MNFQMPVKIFDFHSWKNGKDVMGCVTKWRTYSFIYFLQDLKETV